MSDIFMGTNLKDIFDSVTESNVELPQFISIIDQANNTTQNNLNIQNGGSLSATSSAFNGQLGGNLSATSNNASEKDVNKLISMLTSDSSSNNFKGLSETSTVSLENQLRDILNQDGGAKKKKKQKGGNGLNVDDVKQFFTNLQSQGVNVDLKLNNKTMSEFFGLATNTTTELNPLNNVSSATSSVNLTNIENLSATSDKSLPSITGGGKKKKSKKSSKKNKKQNNDDDEQNAGANKGFLAFLELKKYIANKLGISNGPQAAKVAGAVQKEMKEKNPTMNAVELADEGRKHFDKNLDHYKQMLTK